MKDIYIYNKKKKRNKDKNVIFVECKMNGTKRVINIINAHR